MRYVSLLMTSAVLAAALFSIPAAADPYGFKGVTLGSPLSLVTDNPKLVCRPASAPTADRICYLGPGETETIAGAPVDSVYYFYFRKSLTEITIGFDETDFEAVVKALREKYGSPTRSRQTVKTLAGKSYENVTYRWQQTGQSIEALRYSARIDKSAIRISDDGAAERIKQLRTQSAGKQPKNDL